MRFWGWLKRSPGERTELRRWHAQWAEAVAALDGAAVGPLEAALGRQPPLADDLEVEEEMLDGLRQLLALERDLAAGSLPAVDTTHRVVGADACHFSAPVSIPDDPSQPTGRLLLTSSRAVFAGGARVPGLAWHAAREVVQSGRDLLFVRAGAEDGVRFRCNSYGEALRGAAIARHLARKARRL
jgi:hypothetical protein